MVAGSECPHPMVSDDTWRAFKYYGTTEKECARRGAKSIRVLLDVFAPPPQ